MACVSPSSGLHKADNGGGAYLQQWSSEMNWSSHHVSAETSLSADKSSFQLDL